MGDIHLCNSSFWTDQGNLQQGPPSAALSVLALFWRPSGRFFLFSNFSRKGLLAAVRRLPRYSHLREETCGTAGGGAVAGYFGIFPAAAAALSRSWHSLRSLPLLRKSGSPNHAPDRRRAGDGKNPDNSLSVMNGSAWGRRHRRRGRPGQVTGALPRPGFSTFSGVSRPVGPVFAPRRLPPANPDEV